MDGEAHAWELLAGLEPGSVCSRSLAAFDAAAAVYTVSLFGMPVTVAPSRREIMAANKDGEMLLTKMAYFSRLSVLHYLIGAEAVPPSGQLVRPSDLKIASLFLGSHTLPLNLIADRYGRDTAGFMGQGIRFSGIGRKFGDAAVELHPFPRMPVTIILWREDAEFAARADLLFDRTCEHHVPPDILWSIAMVSVKIMLVA